MNNKQSIYLQVGHHYNLSHQPCIYANKINDQKKLLQQVCSNKSTGKSEQATGQGGALKELFTNELINILWGCLMALDTSNYLGACGNLFLY